MKKNDEIRNLNTALLAYIGDAVYEVYVRRYLLQSDRVNVDKLHTAAIKYVRADGQAVALKRISDGLTEEEQQIVRRARNHKITSKPKNADPVIYKSATAFEALIGYLDLTGQKDRLSEIFVQAVEAIKGERNDAQKTGEK